MNVPVQPAEPSIRVSPSHELSGTKIRMKCSLHGTSSNSDIDRYHPIDRCTVVLLRCDPPSKLDADSSALIKIRVTELTMYNTNGTLDERVIRDIADAAAMLYDRLQEQHNAMGLRMFALSNSADDKAFELTKAALPAMSEAIVNATRSG